MTAQGRFLPDKLAPVMTGLQRVPAGVMSIGLKSDGAGRPADDYRNMHR
jgi:hypothetical protein